MHVTRTPREAKTGRKNADPPVTGKSGVEHGTGLSISFDPDQRGGSRIQSAAQAKRILGKRAHDSRQAVIASPAVKMNGSGL